MREKICEIPYINRIRDNICDVKPNDLHNLYNDLNSADCVILLGSGRSRYSASIPLSQLAMTSPKTVLSPDDVGFPGGTLLEALPRLERKYENILILVNSGSGETLDPKTSLEEVATYIEKNKSENIKITAITSRSRSTIGKIAREHGHVVEVKGREEKRRVGNLVDYSRGGIMGDMFELGSGLILQSEVEAIHHQDESKIFDFLEDELSIIGKYIDENLETYESVADVLERRNDVFGSAKGTGEKVVNMSLIRLYHVKSLLGDCVYRAGGINTPRPRAGDLQISVSYSGETGIVVEWCKKFKSFRGYQFSITGNPNSSLAKNSDFKIMLEEKVGPNKPRRFYMRAAYLLSPQPLQLMRSIEKRGLSLPESVLEWYHSVIE